MTTEDILWKYDNKNSHLILLKDSLSEFLIDLLVPVRGLSSALSITALTVALNSRVGSNISHHQH